MPMNFAKQATNKTRKAKKKMAMQPRPDPRDVIAKSNKGLMNRPNKENKKEIGGQPVELVIEAISLLEELRNGRA